MLNTRMVGFADTEIDTGPDDGHEACFCGKTALCDELHTDGDGRGTLLDEQTAHHYRCISVQPNL